MVFGNSYQMMRQSELWLLILGIITLKGLAMLYTKSLLKTGKEKMR